MPDRALLATDAVEPVLDHARIQAIRGLPGYGEHCFHVAGTVFLRQAPLQLAALSAAHAAGDEAALQRLAHTLKGTAATVGLATLARRLAELQAAGADQPDRRGALVAACHAAAGLALPALAAELSQSGGSEPPP